MMEHDYVEIIKKGTDLKAYIWGTYEYDFVVWGNQYLIDCIILARSEQEAWDLARREFPDEEWVSRAPDTMVDYASILYYWREDNDE